MVLLLCWFAKTSFAAGQNYFDKSISYQPTQNNVSTHNIQEMAYLEMYQEPHLGLRGTIAYQFQRYFHENWGMLIAITGAFLGDKGGYGTSSLGVCWRWPILPHITSQTQVFVGAGGGKQLPAAGGLVLNAQTGLAIKLFEHVNIITHIGRLNFILGSYQLDYVNFGISFSGIELVSVEEK